jgi:hypothetical protein
VLSCAAGLCTANGDSSATCTEQATGDPYGYTCNCTTGYSFSNGRCISGCSATPNPCATNGTSNPDTTATCTNQPTGWTCGCNTGWVQQTGTSTPTCVDYDACANSGGNTACAIGAAGNKCNDQAAPSTSFTCTCGNAAYIPSGNSCIDPNDCSPNHCLDGGDASAVCTDSSPAAGYTCACSAGFTSNGVTCVSNCNMPTSNPCKSQGDTGSSCAVAGGGWTCTCSMGYTPSAGTQPTCVNFNACTMSTGNASCVVSAGNVCNDLPPSSTSYTCTCNNAYVGTGTTSCVDPNDCIPNHCLDGGNTTATCTDLSPSAGYTCGCSTGFTLTGGTCQSTCHSGSNPCNVNGDTGSVCSIVGTGGWSCACTSGYVSNGATLATCGNLNACTPTAISKCTVVNNSTIAGNGCNDLPPPSTSYTCTCDGLSTVAGMSGGQPACVDKNDCVPDHCLDGGDSLAVCTDHKAPLTGYDCTCSSALWSLGTVAGKTTCVDTDECATGNPCVNGACTNVPLGGGYVCSCDKGYVTTGGKTPTCVHPDSCSGDRQTDIACVIQEAGNVCVDDAPPLIGYTCACNNPAYTESLDHRSCVDKNGCVPDHCGDNGDRQANCSDRHAPKAGYDCDCGPGWMFDGTTCVDIDECTGGANPCGHGDCSNTNGGYECVCAPGYVPSKTAPLTCVASAGNQNWTYKTIPGSCSLGGRGDDASAAAMLMLAALLLPLLRRSARGPRRARRA